MPRFERAQNVLVGLCVLAWAVLGMAEPSTRDTPVRIAVAVLNVQVGLLFLLRRPLVRQGSTRSLVACLPSLVMAGLAFKLAPPTDRWPLCAEAVFLAGTATVVVAFFYLGRSFAVFPAVRGTIARGPYRVVRHPAYAGEILMVFGCFLASGQLAPALVAFGLLPAVLLRIRAEEAVLDREPAYLRYREQVVWRLIPGLW